MNYVYDINVNFNKNFYDFFDWNRDDKVLHLKKIPIFRVSDNDYFNLKNSVVKVDNLFLQNIYKKTDLFTKNNVINNYYCCLITNSFEIIALKFNKKGNIIAKSSLIIEEELEILEYVNKMKQYSIKYDVVCIQKNVFFRTRYEINLRNRIFNFLCDLKKLKKYDLVNYLFFECFNKYETDFFKEISLMKKCLFDNFDSVYKVFDNYFKISSLKNKKVYNFD